MRETTNKYKHLGHIPKAKTVCYPFTTIYCSMYLLVSTFIPIHFDLPNKIYPKTAKIYMSAVGDACDA